MANLQISIRGYLVGPIWWPSGSECWKECNYDLTREDSRFSEHGTLRDHVVAATNDGDFQSCSLAQGELIVTRRDGRRTVTRAFPLEHFPSIKDCLHPDPDWWPPFDND